MLIKDSAKELRRSRFFPFPRDLCFPQEKPLFRKWAKNRRRLVEIGVFEGASAAIFRSVMHPTGHLHLIDPFIPDSMNPALSARKPFAKLNLMRVRNGKITWHEDFSFQVVKTWHQPVDFLFIDGDHTEASCSQDWTQWSPFVEVGGVAIFHDARFGKGDGSWWDGWEGPTAVVDRLFRGANKITSWEIVDEAGTAVAVRRLR